MSQQNKKPKILIFSLAYLPFIGGAEIAVNEIVKRLNYKFNFDLITAKLDKRLPSEEIINGLKIYRVGKGRLSKYFFPWLAFKKAKELHRKNNYQIVWGIMAFWAGWAALKFKERFSKVKYLLTLQSGDSDNFVKKRTWFWHWRYKKIYQKADHIQVISNWLRERAKKFGYQGEISLVPNGTSLKCKEIKKLRRNKNRKIILTISRLVEKNGLEDLIKAMKLINYPPVRLLIIGSGPLRKSLENLVKKLNLESKVEFLGKISHKKIWDYYSQADVFVRPSLSEGFGNVFIEAMAAGVPVVATPVGGIPDFLKDKETGWFCKVKNPQSIAETVKYILDNKNQKEVRRVAVNAEKMIEKGYTWDIVAKKMKNIFLDLLS